MLGDHLRTKMQLFGMADCPDTMKCLLTAGEKGVDIDTRVIGGSNAGSDAEEFRSISPFGTVPCLRDIDFVVYGTQAVMSYLDDKGFGPSLVPRNGLIRALHYQWTALANQHVAPHVEKLLANSSDDTTISALAAAFDALDNQLKTKRARGDFIVGEFSLADIHWASYAHGVEISGHSDLLASRSEVSKWWQMIKSHKSTSKEDFVAYGVLPSIEDIRENRLSDVQINV